MRELKELEEKIQINFTNIAILQEAFIHRSYINENKDEKIHHNERMEFLGDAVLELLVTNYLYHTYPNRPEGELTSFRSAIVKTTSLAETALQLELGEYISMSRGEEATGGRKRPYILANTFEALLGAIYLDQGLEISEIFVKTFLFTKIQNIVENRLDIDNKSKLQEISQDDTNFTPLYDLIEAKGPDHDRIFTMGVKIGKYLFGTGKGKNKQSAEQNAAAEAIKNWEELYAKHFK